MKKMPLLSAIFVILTCLFFAVSCKTAEENPAEESPKEILIGSMDLEGDYYFGGIAGATFAKDEIIVAEKTDDYGNSVDFYNNYFQREQDSEGQEKINLRDDITVTDLITENVKIKITEISVANDMPALLSYQYTPTKRTNINSYKIEIPIRIETARTTTKTIVRKTETVHYQEKYDEENSQFVYIELGRDYSYDPPVFETDEYWENSYASEYIVTFMKVGKNYYCENLQIYGVEGNPSSGNFKLGSCKGKLNASCIYVDSSFEKIYDNFSVLCQDLNFEEL